MTYNIYSCCSSCVCIHMQGRMWPWILLLMAVTSAIADGRYTYDDIQRIVVQHAMQFWDFPQGYYQYGVLILLPADKNSRLFLHPYPKITNPITTMNNSIIGTIKICSWAPTLLWLDPVMEGTITQRHSY